MGGVLLRACAKVNYALEVRGLRGDGYHEISSVLQSVSLADELEIERSRGGFELSFEPEGVEIGPVEENTVYKAWALLWETSGHELPTRIRLHKKIPAGAGLGGGSADAAAVLVGMNELFDLGLDAEQLRTIGARIGADVPFCLSGGTALAQGVGEILTPLPAPPAHRLMIAKPKRGADTGGIYRAYDERDAGIASADQVVAALRSGGLTELAGAVGNDLEPVTTRLVPEVAAHKLEMLRAGALGAAMTGTGTAVYGIFDAESGDSPTAVASLRAPFLGVFEPAGAGVIRL
jgi:4-diphosphocytidyl-2-C-methyl-D-erythritol kinase